MQGSARADDTGARARAWARTEEAVLCDSYEACLVVHERRGLEIAGGDALAEIGHPVGRAEGDGA